MSRSITSAAARVRLIDRSPGAGDETEVTYRLQATCRAKQEGHVRVLIQHEVSSAGLRLQRLASRDLDDPNLVEITAVVLAPPDSQRVFEEAVARLSLEPHVSAVGWETEPDDSAP
jgi:putative Mg2+ transporter-C (MgtC) family protein